MADGASSVQQWKDVLQDRFFKEAPGLQRQSVEQYKVVRNLPDAWPPRLQHQVDRCAAHQ